MFPSKLRRRKRVGLSPLAINRLFLQASRVRMKAVGPCHSWLHKLSVDQSNCNCRRYPIHFLVLGTTDVASRHSSVSHLVEGSSLNLNLLGNAG